MTDLEAGDYWNQNAEAWTLLARAGFDIYRDYLNTPGFFKILPEIQSLSGIDMGCGEGYNTRLLAEKGARMQAIDISPLFIEKAREEEQNRPLGIQYQVASATNLPFETATFDFAASFMCLMDLPEPSKGIEEAFRVLKPGGFFQFSILHPCFNPPHRKNMRDANGRTYAIQVGDYFQDTHGRVDEWIFTKTPDHLKAELPRFKTPIFAKTLSYWLNAVIQSGFQLEQVHEPYPDDTVIAREPALQDAQTVAYFLHIRARKPYRSNS